MGPMYARFAILMHEAAHKLLFTNKRGNDLVGKWIVAYPAFMPVQLYRRGHFAHHKDEFGPDEPDIAFYAPLPVHAAGLPATPLPRRRRHQRVEEPRAARENTPHQAVRPIGLSIFAVQAVCGGDVGRHRALVDLPSCGGCPG